MKKLLLLLLLIPNLLMADLDAELEFCNSALVTIQKSAKWGIELKNKFIKKCPATNLSEECFNRSNQIRKGIEDKANKIKLGMLKTKKTQQGVLLTEYWVYMWHMGALKGFNIFDENKSAETIALNIYDECKGFVF